MQLNLIICSINSKFNDLAISLNQGIQFTYAEPVVSNAINMQPEEKRTPHVLLSEAFTSCFSD